jgi:hypothetical protein
MPAWSSAVPEPYRFRRVRSVELMDLPGLPARERALALQGLDRITGWPGQRGPLLRALKRLLGAPTGRRLKLVEVGAGTGQTARWLQAELRAAGYRAELRATDLFPLPGVQKLDALKKNLPEADVYFSNLFLHHLPDAGIPAMFKAQARASRLGVVHFDLQRHWMHYIGARLALRWAHRINQIDGLRSIQQAYTRAELAALAQEALPGFRLRWTPPFRWILTWKKP